MNGLILKLTKEQEENVKVYFGPVLGWSYVSNKNNEEKQKYNKKYQFDKYNKKKGRY